MKTTDWAKKDWQASGVDEEIVAANLRVAEGEDAQNLLLYSPKLERTNTGRVAERYLKITAAAARGGWYVRGLSPESNWQDFSDYVRFKPRFPGRDREGKQIKYLNPPKAGFECTYLSVPDRVAEKVARRYGLDAPAGKDFWAWVSRTAKVEILITEGEKKAAKLLSEGFAAISIPGIWMFATKVAEHRKELIPSLAAMRFVGRRCAIVFDADLSVKTQQSVRMAARQLSKLLLAAKARSVRAIEIPPGDRRKQGVDDFLVGGGRLEDCPSVPGRLWGIQDLEEKLEGHIQEFAPNFFLPEYTIEPGLTCVVSPTGTGKTKSLENLVGEQIREGETTILAITNRITTGRSVCGRLGVPYIDDGSDEVGGRFFGICVESCKPNGKGRIKVSALSEEEVSRWKGSTIILDEFDQTLWQALSAPTCAKDRPEILATLQGLLTDCLHHGGHAIALSADLKKGDIDFLARFLPEGQKPKIVRMRRRTGKKYDVFSYPTKEDVVAKAIQFAQQGKSLLFSVEGQKEQTLFGTQTLERLFAEVGVDPQDILRIDSASLADPSHPANVEKINQLAKQYRIVLTSPAISSCVSIEDGPFDAVFDVSAGLQSVAETRQRYDRVRAFEDEKGRYTNVDRHVFVPKISTIRYGNGSFRAEDMIAGKHRLDEFAMELLRADCLINRTSLANFNAVTLQTWAEKASRRNLEALAYRDRVEYLCVSEGARWIEVEEVVCTQGVKDLMKRIREENVARHHDAICAAKKIDIEKALALGRKRALTVTEALELRRWEIEDRYGREVDREILALDDNPGLYKKLRLHFYLRNLDVAKKLDARQVERLESHPLPYHKPDLKLVAAKAFVLKQLGVERFLDPEREFTGTSPEVVEFVASVISFKEDLAKMFGIQLSGTASPMQVVGQFLALIGVKLKSHRRREGEGKIPRYYAFEGYEDDRFLFFQYWRAKAFEILGEVDPALTIEIENQPIAPPDRPQKGDSVAWKKGDRLVSGFYLEDIEGDTARIKERELGISFQVPLSSLEISL